MELPELLKLLRENGIKKFKDKDHEIEFDSIKIPDPSPEPALIDAPVPKNMPAELVNPELMAFDTIRDWSASPGHDDGVAPMPGTDDAPLDAGAA